MEQEAKEEENYMCEYCGQQTTKEKAIETLFDLRNEAFGRLSKKQKDIISQVISNVKDIEEKEA